MLYKIVITKSADTDIQSAIDWENMRSAGLGKRFLTSVDRKLESLAITPLMGSIKHKSVRFVGIDIFQYVIYYRVFLRRKELIILRVIHTKRKPVIN